MTLEKLSQPTTLQKMTWSIITTVHQKAKDGSAGHAKIWFDVFGTAGITTGDCLIMTISDLEEHAQKLKSAKELLDKEPPAGERNTSIVTEHEDAVK